MKSQVPAYNFTALVIACEARQFWLGVYFSCFAKACNYKNLILKRVNPLFVLVFASEQGTGEKRDLQE